MTSDDLEDGYNVSISEKERSRYKLLYQVYRLNNIRTQYTQLMQE